MFLKLLSLNLVLVLLAACGGKTGARTSIKNADGKDSKQKTRGFKAVTSNKGTKKQCLNIEDLVNNKIKSLGQADFRVYTSDLRVLSEDDYKTSNTTSDKVVEHAQTNLIIEKANDKNFPFYQVDYAKNIIKDTPSPLAPFKIVKQTECKKVEIKFNENEPSQEYEIVQDEFTEFQLVLRAKGELYQFRLLNNGVRLDFVNYFVTNEREVCDDPKSLKNLLARSTHTYEWNYRDTKKLDISYRVAKIFDDILKNLPVDVEKSLSENVESDTARINIKAEDYTRILNHVRKPTNTAKCR